MLTTHQQAINQFLKTVGIQNQLADLPGMAAPYAYTDSIYMGIPIRVVLDQDKYVYANMCLGYVPKMNVAPLYRRLLTLSAMTIGIYFCINDMDNAILLRSSRIVEGLDANEFKAMIDSICAWFLQFGPNLITEFQIPPQPSAYSIT